MNRIAGGDIFANIDKSNVAAERLFLNFQWIHWSEMTVLYLYFDSGLGGHGLSFFDFGQ